MKHLLKTVMVCVIAICCVAGTMSCISCSKDKQEKQQEFHKLYQKETNPSFASLEEVLLYQEKVQKQFIEDSAFRQMTPQTLEKVVTVLKNTNVVLNKQNIAEQYLQSKKVFDNLTPPIPKDEEVSDSVINVELITKAKTETSDD